MCTRLRPQRSHYRSGLPGTLAGCHGDLALSLRSDGDEQTPEAGSQRQRPREIAAAVPAADAAGDRNASPGHDASVGHAASTTDGQHGMQPTMMMRPNMLFMQQPPAGHTEESDREDHDAQRDVEGSGLAPLADHEPPSTAEPGPSPRFLPTPAFTSGIHPGARAAGL